MNKSALKTFATTARRQLRDMATLKAAQLGITEKEILQPTSKGDDYETYETKAGAVTLNQKQVKARAALVSAIHTKKFENVIEQVAYTWFNRLVAIRYLEVNGFLPHYILGSQEGNKEPDLVKLCSNVAFDLNDEDKKTAEDLRDKAQLEKLFQFLFVKCCNSLSDVLPCLFADENRNVTDYTTLLLDLTYTQETSVVRELINLGEEDFKEQVQIVGWLYQYYNSELKDETFAALKKNVKIDKDHIPAATQLFTPDWIVRYMVQNSVGRMYVEGHGKPSCKKDWKYYLDEAEQTAEVNAELDKIRAEYKKIQLEDMKILDPSMGSGHILVYAFDLLMQLYEEEGYMPEEAALLIAEKNLWGLDIDTRAWQLSSFAITMKVLQYNKKYFHTNNSKWLNISKPLNLHVYAITESNDVKISNPAKLGESKKIADTLIRDFNDACEYGSIISPTVTLAELETLKRTLVQIDEMGTMGSLTNQIEADEIISGLWPLIELATVFIQKYDVVTTNPPYRALSDCESKLNYYVQNNYKDSKADLFAVFIEKCGYFSKQNGYIAMITQHAWMFLGSYEKLRTKLDERTLINMAHLGPRAFDEIGGEVVQATTFVQRNSCLSDYKGRYVRLVDYDGEEKKENEFSNQKNMYSSLNKYFMEIPGHPYAYWLSNSARNAWKQQTIENLCEVKQGLATCNNSLFLRDWYEVNYTKIGFNCKTQDESAESHKKWFPYNKGGGFRKYYGNNKELVNWENYGYDIHKYNKIPLDYGSAPVRAKSFYFKEGITYSLISTGGTFSARNINNGFIFDVGGSMLFPRKEDKKYILGVLSSKIAKVYFEAINPTQNKQVGDICKIPIIFEQREDITQLVEENITISKDDWDSFENSWNFSKHPLLPKKNFSISNKLFIKDCFDEWNNECNERFNKLKSNEENLNRILINTYKLQDELTPEVTDDDISIRKADLNREIKSLISYAVGCMMGRYSLSTPGLIYAGGNMNDVMAKYKIFVPDEDAIIPINDTAWFKDDIVERFKSFLTQVYGESTLEENMKFIADALRDDVAASGTAEEKIRSYFVGKTNNKGICTKGFYKDHLYIYQNHPIYWLFDSGKKNGFKALIYLHRYDTNTVERVHDEYLKPLPTLMDNAIMTCQRMMQSNTASERDKAEARERITHLQQQQEEIAIYQPVLKHVALENIPLDLDDGVTVNYAKFQNQVLHRDNLADSTLDLLAKIK